MISFEERQGYMADSRPKPKSLPERLSVIAVKMQLAGLGDEAHAALDAAVKLDVVAGDLVMLRKAIKSGDPRTELLQRVSDALDALK